MLHEAGQATTAIRLLDAGIDLYERIQPPGVYGYDVDVAIVEMLALRGGRETALARLREAIDSGWRHSWRLHLANRNLDSLREDPVFTGIITELEADSAQQREAVRQIPNQGELDLRYAKNR